LEGFFTPSLKPWPYARTTLSRAATDGRDDRDLRTLWHGRLKAARVADIFFADEDVDVLPDLSLLGYHTASHAWAAVPQRFQGFSQGGRGRLNYNAAFPAAERTQWAGY
jgi:hypothetical protein